MTYAPTVFFAARFVWHSMAWLVEIWTTLKLNIRDLHLLPAVYIAEGKLNLWNILC